MLSGVTFADFNSDGRLDVALTRGTVPAVEIHLGQADGSFALSQTLVDSHFGTSVMTTADVNHDGHLDVLLGAGRVYALYGDGTGQFTVGPYLFPGTASGLYFTDVDGDGLEDLVSASTNQNMVFAGDGTFFSTTGVPISESVWKYIQGMVDVDGDGELDLVVRNNPTTGMAWLRGQAGFTFGAPQMIETGFRVDGFLPVAMGALPRRWILAGPTGLHVLDETAGGPVDTLVHAIPSRNVAQADMNGDGILDVVTSDDVATISHGTGAGGFVWEGITRLVGGETQDIGLWDTNADGRTDIVAANRKVGFTVIPGVVK